MKTFEDSLDSPVSTRGRIVRHLLDGPRTIEELAQATSVTKNAVRSQIALLQTEGVVEIQGATKSTRRPAARYALRPGSDVHFSKAYPLVLSALIQRLAKELPDEQFKDLMRRLGQHLAASVPRPSGSPEDRIQNAVAVLKSMGSPAQAKREDEDIVIMSPACLISAAVSADARVCGAMEAFVRGITGLPVRECCERRQRPACRFKIKLPKNIGPPDPVREYSKSPA